MALEWLHCALAPSSSAWSRGALTIVHLHGFNPLLLCRDSPRSIGEGVYAWCACFRAGRATSAPNFQILIGDEYHTVIVDGESRDIPFARISVAAEFIERHLRHGLPPAVAYFDTRNQSESWLSSAAEPPRHAFITIQGEYYLATYWKNVNHRALYPLTRVDDLEKEHREEREGEESA